MNITFINIVEIITCLLIIGKLFQISKLYRQSNASHLQTHNRGLNTALSSPSAPSRKLDTRNTNTISSRFKENYSQHNLPLPEVSFTEGLPLPDVSYSSNNEGLFANNKHQPKHKTILNNYIDDFFFETPQVYHEAGVVEFKKYKLDSRAEDEFITVEDEHEEFIRAFESLEKNYSFVR